MSIIDEGLSWLNDQRQTFLTIPIVYSRGTASVTIDATRGSSSFTRKGQDGVAVKVVQTDWLISAADLILNGQAVQPEKGDRISDGTHTYQVEQNPSDGCWKWSGPSYYTMRIHSKQIG